MTSFFPVSFVSQNNIFPRERGENLRHNGKLAAKVLQGFWQAVLMFKHNYCNIFRYSGKVISLKQAAGVIKVKVKFDLHSQDKFDKW